MPAARFSPVAGTRHILRSPRTPSLGVRWWLPAMPRQAVLSPEEKRARARERDRLKKRRRREDGLKRSLERQRNALAMRRWREQRKEGGARRRLQDAEERGQDRRKDPEAKQQRPQRREEQARASRRERAALVPLGGRRRSRRRKERPLGTQPHGLGAVMLESGERVSVGWAPMVGEDG